MKPSGKYCQVNSLSCDSPQYIKNGNKRDCGANTNGAVQVPQSRERVKAAERNNS